MHRVSSSRGDLIISRPIPARAESHDGFSMVEGLVAGVILIAAVLGTVGAFNVITLSLGGTSDRNISNTTIDKDVSLIKKISVEYTSCVAPSGSVPAGNDLCDVSSRFSNYYFPMNPTVARQDEFLNACRSADPAAHITAGFVQAINQIPALGSGVVRSLASREAPADPKNHNVVVEYRVNGSSVRLLKVAPVVSAWCG